MTTPDDIAAMIERLRQEAAEYRLEFGWDGKHRDDFMADVLTELSALLRDVAQDAHVANRLCAKQGQAWWDIEDRLAPWRTHQ